MMTQEDSDYNVRLISKDEIPYGMLEPGKFIILGEVEDIETFTHKFHTNFINAIAEDNDSIDFSYDLVFSNKHYQLAEYLNCNILFSFPSPDNSDGEILIAKSEQDKLGLTAAAILREAKKRIQRSYETAIALFALGAIPEYRNAVDKLFRQKKESFGFSNISFGAANLGGGLGALLNLFPFHKISDKKIRAVYNSLPDRYSDLYERRNPESAGIIRYSLEVIDQKNLVDLLFETAKTDRNLFKKLETARQKIASKFQIRVRKWSSDQKKFFKDQYKYCIYVLDMRGNETPIKFRNNPSYCLFMMHVLDRQKRGEHTTALVFKDNEEEFKKLYHSILDETPDHVKTFCKEMIRREDPESGVLRKGRYDDYIKDINDTLDELMGSPDSLALKIGHGQFLQIPQGNIEIDPNLPKFNFV